MIIKLSLFKINNILKEKHNLKLKDFLNCRTFLDHNRIYRKPNKNINHKISTGGSFSFKGRLIPGKELITNFYKKNIVCDCQMSI